MQRNSSEKTENRAFREIKDLQKVDTKNAICSVDSSRRAEVKFTLFLRKGMKVHDRTIKQHINFIQECYKRRKMSVACTYQCLHITSKCSLLCHCGMGANKLGEHNFEHFQESLL